ncbi:MAG: glycosyltransferase [Cyclobacteriaceae bacterium]
MKTILFDPLPSTGHVNSFLRMASYLRGIGYRCVFIGSAAYSEMVTSLGFEYEMINPFVVRNEKMQLKEKGWFYFLLESMVGTRNKILKEELAFNSNLYTASINKINPHLIILDDQYSYKAFFYSTFKLPIVLLQTKVNPLRAKGIPPFQSHHVPDDSLWSKTVVIFSWMSLLVKKQILRSFFYLISLSNTSTKFLKNRFRDSGYTIEKDRCFLTGIKELPLVMASPRVFDFPRPGSKDVYHFFKASKPGDEVQDQRLKSIVDKKKADGDKIIYVSLGTVTKKYERTCTRFYNKLFKAASKLSDGYFIVSVGAEYDISMLADKPNNVSIFQQVPQKEILSSVDIMFSHGGMNSVMECINAEVPMIILPLSLDWDQPGNGARVAYHGLGICSKLRSITPGMIVKLILKLSENISAYKKNLIDFKKLVARQSIDDMKEFEQLIERSVEKKEQIEMKGES